MSGAHSHDEACDSTWTDSVCGCEIRMGIEDWGRADHNKLREAGIPVAVVPRDSFMGIDPDYDSKIPEPKDFSIEKLIEKLNKEAFPWDNSNFSAHLSIDWVWQTDTILPTGVYLTLQKNKEVIGQLLLTDPWADFIATGFEPHFNCAVGDIRFIRECTGWTVNV